jgi:hypothetical protein
VPRLTFEGAPIVEIDAELPLAEVLAQAKAAIDLRLSQIETADGAVSRKAA